MSLADLLTGCPNPKQGAEILASWYAKMVGVEPSSVKTIIIDNNICFPIFHTDTLQDIIDRYAKMFPVEAKATIEQCGIQRDDNPSGMSKGHQLKSLMCIPVILKAAIVELHGEKWFADAKNVRKLSTLMPKFRTSDKT